jgi:hypothetical protein
VWEKRDRGRVKRDRGVDKVSVKRDREVEKVWVKKDRGVEKVWVKRGSDRLVMLETEADLRKEGKKGRDRYRVKRDREAVTDWWCLGQRQTWVKRDRGAETDAWSKEGQRGSDRLVTEAERIKGQWQMGVKRVRGAVTDWWCWRQRHIGEKRNKGIVALGLVGKGVKNWQSSQYII